MGTVRASLLDHIMSGTKRKYLPFLLVQLLAFSSVKADSTGAPCCILDKRFGEFCPTTCGVGSFFQNYQSKVNKELEDMENDLDRIQNVTTITKNTIDNVVQSNTIMKKQSPDNYIQRIREIQSEILKFETISLEKDYELQQLEHIVSSNDEHIKRLKILTTQLHNRCSEPCQDTTQIHEITGQDCQDIADKGATTSGLYYIQPLKARRSFLVYCEIDTAGRGWTVLQRRLDGSVSFAQNWIPYKEGFGYLSPDDSTEFWLGNEKIHLITVQGRGPYILQITLNDWSREQRTARYMDFKVGSEADSYRLRYSYYDGGDAGDAFDGFDFGDDSSSKFYTAHNGMQFSTPDVDNDKYEASCAYQDQSGWWMNKCHAGNLNGRYHTGGIYRADQTTGGFDDGIIWATWHDRWYSLKGTTMKIMPYKSFEKLRSQVEQGQGPRGDV
ncbi:fibrinogen gamma chain [Leucoraja erinacea]|uniref:fibrinogen gamma chain n=1 Tax=Leucoraja erinaceus TaxID=7782 RepID=UPI0024578B25|nr:fibrinogen gamma chain [Leucoraja erinacea]